MSVENALDPRTILVRTKFFSLHPKPLERWLWRQGLPQAAERVFWLHWEEGMRSGDWCSEIPIKRVARECCVDPSTVTRAYQLLKARGLLRREDPGRDPNNPFQQAVAVTEVRLPRELLADLSRSPNRSTKPRNERSQQTPRPNVEPNPPLPPNRTIELTSIGRHSGALDGTLLPSSPQSSPGRPTRQDIQALWARASADENARYFAACRDRHTTMVFDLDSHLTSADRDLVLGLLAQQAAATPPKTSTPRARPAAVQAGALRRLSVLELARVRRQLVSHTGGTDAHELLRQVVWSVEEGALQRFSLPLALNIAFKKIREGAWSKPNRLPPNWLCRDTPTWRAPAEQCTDA